MILSSHGIIGSSIGQVDADAQAFFDRVAAATGTLSATEKTAVNTLVVKMKFDGIWGKMKAIYPMVGASAAACAQNLKSANFTATMYGTIIYASTGINTNGLDGYYDTNYNPSIHGSQNSLSMGVYLRTDLNGIGSSLDIGTEFATGALLQIYAKVDIVGQTYATRCNSANIDFPTNTDSRGFYAVSRNSSSNYFKQKNNTITTITDTSSGLTNLKVFGFKNTTTYTQRQQAFAFLGEGITTTEMSNYYNAVQSFQQTLNRDV